MSKRGRGWRRLRHIVAFAMVCLSLTAPWPVSSTSLLPNGQQQFLSPSGVPLSGGFVFMYNPQTTICKTTWKDSTQTTPNACPIVLDASGSALIYGSGCYSQLVTDALSNTIYNQLTCEPGVSNLVVWGGTAAGTANAITLASATAFIATDGQIVNFIPIATNTGATTIAAGAMGPVPVVKDTTGGPVALSGGEIVFSGSGNIVSVAYSAVQGNFHLLTTAIPSASGTTAPLCGAQGLVLTNNAGTPNTIIALSADQVLTQSTAGLSFNRSNVSVNINLTTGTATSTANGMDGEVVGTSQWLHIYGIDNGSAFAGLASTSATGPTMPSGYTFKCRLGAMQVDGAGNLYRSRQVGSTAQYIVTAGSNTATLWKLFNGTVGTNCTTATPTWAAQTVQGNGQSVPPTATGISLALMGNYNGAGLGSVIAAPNNAYGGQTSTNPPFVGGQIADSSVRNAYIQLEATTIQVCASAAGGAIFTTGWKDKVNAN